MASIPSHSHRGPTSSVTSPDRRQGTKGDGTNLGQPRDGFPAAGGGVNVPDNDGDATGRQSGPVPLLDNGAATTYSPAATNVPSTRDCNSLHRVKHLPPPPND